MTSNDQFKNIRDNKERVYSPTKKNVLYMLSESNHIEDVWDRLSLTHARRAWEYIMRFDKINNQIIKETHRILMQKQDIERKYKGDWRDIPVSIGGHIKNQSKPVIDSLMRDWCNKTNTVDRNFDPVTLHIEFENIHPFVDGNGRMGRILLNWHSVKRNEGPLIVYTYENRWVYYHLFNKAERWAKLMEMVPALAEEMKGRHGEEKAMEDDA